MATAITEGLSVHRHKSEILSFHTSQLEKMLNTIKIKPPDGVLFVSTKALSLTFQPKRL